MQLVATTGQEVAAVEPEAAVLAGYVRADKQLIASRALLSRTDSKFILTRRQLAAALTVLSRSFALLASPNAFWGDYASIYLDTSELRLFHDHRRGRRRRFKVRIRHYHDRRLTFLEVKKKSQPGHTDKHRRPLSYEAATLGAEDLAFLRAAIAPAEIDLVPTLTTEFRRVTLVGRQTVERVTFDLGLRVLRGDAAHSFGDAVIAEVKQPTLWNGSPTVAALRACGARAAGPSKYCMGIMALDTTVRANRLKPNLRALEELRDG